MPMIRFVVIVVVLLIPAPGRCAEKVDFAREIRPILSNHCFKCHGPATQKAKLRLDDRSSAIARGAITPGKPAESELLSRVRLPHDDELRMPPAEVGAALKPEQIERLKAWIEQGAEYPQHWSFVKPVRPAVPQLKEQNFDTLHPIDSFVRASLEAAGIEPAPEADRATLLRRVTLDLTGLLPTPQEVEAFQRDPAEDAFEKVVTRLLASPHYGERHARHWLDLARYADSNGYTIDGPRQIWPYRDWLIKALNDDMPFDRFTIEQLAGDLLPNATKEQKIATGFHRNTGFNEEGGTDPEQFRVERTVDRTNTTAAVWLGLTLGCAQCHDHKYDPISQKEYYSLYAFFDSCEEPTLPLGGPPELESKIADLQQLATESRLVGNDAETKRLEAEIKKVQGKVPTTLVLRDRKTPRQTHVHLRGDFVNKGDVVSPALPTSLMVPATVTGVAALARLTRLDLAKWLVSPDHPLTARVVVNREWQKFFGRGLVETENDFGFQGNFPTHPELLDWLAVEFMESGWSLKKLHQLIVTSATYQQSSIARKDLDEKDPRNLLLARQTRLRLEAEIIRDAALCASGQLSPKIGGHSVYPFQAKELFAFTQNHKKWAESNGPERFRRGMYTYIWRQSQHPLLTTFDGTDAQTTCTKRNRSNTPLQALHLANDPVFVELAELLGKRIEKEGPADDAGRITFAFKLCFSRPPTTAETTRLKAYLEAKRKTNPKTAWAAVARVLLNLDEFIVRE